MAFLGPRSVAPYDLDSITGMTALLENTKKHFRKEV